MSELTFTGIVKRFAADAPPVLDGLTVSIGAKGLTFVVGKSGSGKSVLCRLAVGLLRPDEGEVTLLDQVVQTQPERALRRLRAQVPYLVQGPALLDWLTLRNNVALASHGSERDGRADEAMARVGLGEFKDRFPPQVGPGIKKRTAIARALVLKPRWLLLDEPTTGLDREAAGQVNEALMALKREGLGAVIVSHDYAALEAMADHVVEVESGRVGYQGDAAGFLKGRTHG